LKNHIDLARPLISHHETAALLTTSQTGLKLLASIAALASSPSLINTGKMIAALPFHPDGMSLSLFVQIEEAAEEKQGL